jgi:DNA-binding CsgD family transcriptional regulator
MDSETKLFEVSQKFLTAATSAKAWTPALESLANLLNTDHAMIIAAEKTSGHVIAAKSAGLSDENFGRFLSPQAASWLAPFIQAMPHGVAIPTVPQMQGPAFERSELYNEVVRPANGYYAVLARQEFSGISLFTATCRPRSAGNFAANDIATMQGLLPSIVNNLELYHRLRIAEQRYTGLADAIDRLDEGVIIADAEGHPVFLNARAKRIVAEADGLNLKAERLEAATPVASRRLREIIAAVAIGGVFKGQRLYLTRPLRPPLLLSILPLVHGAPVTDISQVAIFIKEMGGAVTIDHTAVSEAFRLTARESEVAAMLAGGQSPDEIAVSLDVRVSTIRTHLIHIFEKTGMRSQAALVALLCRFIEPMV